MYISEEKRFVLPYRGAKVALRARYLQSGDLVQIGEKRMELQNGKTKKMKAAILRLQDVWLCRRNRQMGHRTGHKSEWQRWACLYSMWLAGLHIRNQQHIEHEQIARLIDGARQYAMYLVYLRKIRPGDVELFVNEFSASVQELSTKRAPRKVVARARFAESASTARGKYLTDSSGRPNPMATAMQVGAGIGHLQEREQDVIRIGANLDARTLQVFMLIQERIRLYWDLWCFIHDGPINYQSGTKLGITLPDKKLLSLREIFDREGYPSTVIRLRALMDQVSGICERPFVNNARHVYADLDEAVRRLEFQDLSFNYQLQKARDGMLWVFACHFWWMFFLAPLSMLIHDLESAMCALRRESGEKDKVLMITKSLAPDEFEHLEKALAEFERRLGKCSDDLLESKPKPRIRKKLQLIHQKIQADDWRAVKKLASKMAQIF